jgi:hypothetical protein
MIVGAAIVIFIGPEVIDKNLLWSCPLWSPESSFSSESLEIILDGISMGLCLFPYKTYSKYLKTLIISH